MLAYKAFPESCNIFDVVLQCYMSIDMLPKLMADNNVRSLNEVTTAGQVFAFDPSLISDEFLSDEVLRNDYKFCTGTLRPTDPPTLRRAYLLIDHLNNPDEARYETILADEFDNEFLL